MGNTQGTKDRDTEYLVGGNTQSTKDLDPLVVEWDSFMTGKDIAKQKCKQNTLELQARNEQAQLEIQNLQEQNGGLNGVIATLQAQHDEMRASIEALQAQNDEMRASIEALQAQNEDMRANNEALQEANWKLNDENGTYQQRIRDLDHQITKSKQTLGQTGVADHLFRSNVHKAEVRATQLTQENQALQLQIATGDAVNDQLRKRIEKLELERRAFDGRMENASRALGEQKNSMQEEFERMTSEHHLITQALQQEKASISHQVETLQHQISALTDELQASKRGTQKVLTENRTLQGHVNELRYNLEQCEKQNKEHAQNIAHLREYEALAEARIASLLDDLQSEKRMSKAMSASVNDIGRDLDEALIKVERLEDEKRRHDTQIVYYEDTCASTTSRLHAVNVELQAAHARNSELESDLREALGNKDTSNSGIVMLKIQLRDCEAESSKKERLLEKLRGIIKKHKQSIKELKERDMLHEENIGRLQQNIKRLKEKLEASKTVIAAMQTRCSAGLIDPLPSLRKGDHVFEEEGDLDDSDLDNAHRKKPAQTRRKMSKKTNLDTKFEQAMTDVLKKLDTSFPDPSLEVHDNYGFEDWVEDSD
jgi:chromosome segregation ATPase